MISLLRTRLGGTLLPVFGGLVLVVLGVLVVYAHDYRVGALHIDHPWSRATPGGATVGVGYFTVLNTGRDADRLVGAEAAGIAARVEMHESTEVDGVARMREVEAVAIPGGAKVDFKPGGYHLMLMGLKAPLVAGARHPAVLVFEKAGRVEVELAVEALGAPAAANPSPHSHH